MTLTMFLLFINGNNNGKLFPDGIIWHHQTRQLQLLSAFSPQQLCFQNIFKICSSLTEIIVSASSMGNIFTAAENGVQTILSALHGWGNIAKSQDANVFPCTTPMAAYKGTSNFCPHNLSNR